MATSSLLWPLSLLLLLFRGRCHRFRYSWVCFVIVAGAASSLALSLLPISHCTVIDAIALSFVLLLHRCHRCCCLVIVGNLLMLLCHHDCCDHLVIATAIRHFWRLLRAACHRCCCLGIDAATLSVVSLLLLLCHYCCCVVISDNAL